MPIRTKGGYSRDPRTRGFPDYAKMREEEAARKARDAKSEKTYKPQPGDPDIPTAAGLWVDDAANWLGGIWIDT